MDASAAVYWRSLGGLLAATTFLDGPSLPQGREAAAQTTPEVLPPIPAPKRLSTPAGGCEDPIPTVSDDSVPSSPWVRIGAVKSGRPSAAKSSLLLYGNNRLAPGFKKFSVKANTDLIRVTFKCGLDRFGQPCEHRIGLFHAVGDDMHVGKDGEWFYRGKRLAWGNTIPAVDRKTQGKLAQTWRTHFLAKHGWNKHDPRLPRECRLKSGKLLQ